MRPRVPLIPQEGEGCAEPRQRCFPAPSTRSQRALRYLRASNHHTGTHNLPAKICEVDKKMAATDEALKVSNLHCDLKYHHSMGRN